jgi:hypothetical protein
VNVVFPADANPEGRCLWLILPKDGNRPWPLTCSEPEVTKTGLISYGRRRVLNGFVVPLPPGKTPFAVKINK